MNNKCIPRSESCVFAISLANNNPASCVDFGARRTGTRLSEIKRNLFGTKLAHLIKIWCVFFFCCSSAAIGKKRMIVGSVRHSWSALCGPCLSGMFVWMPTAVCDQQLSQRPCPKVIAGKSSVYLLTRSCDTKITKDDRLNSFPKLCQRTLSARKVIVYLSKT